MSDINNICEHGQLQRKCEVCELRAEIARLRSVCMECINTMTRCQERECRCNSPVNPCPRCRFRQTIEYAEEQMKKSDAGKEPSDGV